MLEPCRTLEPSRPPPPSFHPSAAPTKIKTDMAFPAPKTLQVMTHDEQDHPLASSTQPATHVHSPSPSPLAAVARSSTHVPGPSPAPTTTHLQANSVQPNALGNLPGHGRSPSTTATTIQPPPPPTCTARDVDPMMMDQEVVQGQRVPNTARDRSGTIMEFLEVKSVTRPPLSFAEDPRVNNRVLKGHLSSQGGRTRCC